MKTRPQKNKQEAAPPPITENEIEIPASLKKFAEIPEKEALQLLFRPLLTDPEAGPKFAGLLSGIFDVGIPVPDFARKSSRQIFKIMGFDFQEIHELNPENPIFSKKIGQIIGIGEKMQKNPAHPDSIAGRVGNELIDPTIKFTKEIASNAEAELSAAFFQGRFEAGNLMEKMKFLPQRAKVYAIIATLWQSVEKFKSTRELHEWLLSLKDADSNSTFAQSTDSRETRKICLEIGLKFQNSWRKADNKKPRLAQ